MSKLRRPTPRDVGLSLRGEQGGQRSEVPEEDRRGIWDMVA